MKKISVPTIKGGVGKSFLVFNMAGYLCKQGKKVLIIDCDAQGNVSDCCGISDDMDYLTVSDIYESYMRKKDISPSDIVIKSPIFEIVNLDIIPADVSLTMTEMRLVPITGREKILDNYIKKHQNYFDKYDYILFDLNPSINISNQNALYSSDSIVLISDIGKSSFKGVRLLIDAWESICEDLQIENKINGLVINKYDKRIKLSKEFIEYLRESEDLQELSFDTILPDNIKLRETEVVGMPISYYDTKNPGYKAFVELMKEFEQRGVI